MECLAYPCVIQEAHEVIINAVPHQDFRSDVSARDHDIIKLKSQVKSLNKQMKSVVRNVKDREHQVVQLKENLKKVRTEMQEMSRDHNKKEKDVISRMNFAENYAAAFKKVCLRCEEFGFITIQELSKEQLEQLGKGEIFGLKHSYHRITANDVPLNQNDVQSHMRRLEDEKDKLKKICLKLIRNQDEGLENVIDRLTKENEELTKIIDEHHLN